MPHTLKEWSWFLVAALLFLYPSMSKADDIMECVSKGRLAASMVYSVSEGYALEKINVNFQRQPRNRAEAEELAAYVAKLKEEIAGLLEGQAVPANDQDFANRIGIKVTENCAVEYGMKHGTFKKTGSAKPITEREASELMIGTASSTSIEGPPIGMERACSDLKLDIRVIARALSEGKPINELKAFAKNSISQLGPERLEKILTMIDEAYSHEGPIVDWMNKTYAECK